MGVVFKWCIIWHTGSRFCFMRSHSETRGYLTQKHSCGCNLFWLLLLLNLEDFCDTCDDKKQKKLYLYDVESSDLVLHKKRLDRHQNMLTVNTLQCIVDILNFSTFWLKFFYIEGCRWNWVVLFFFCIMFYSINQSMTQCFHCVSRIFQNDSTYIYTNSEFMLVKWDLQNCIARLLITGRFHGPGCIHQLFDGNSRCEGLQRVDRWWISENM